MYKNFYVRSVIINLFISIQFLVKFVANFGVGFVVIIKNFLAVYTYVV